MENSRGYEQMIIYDITQIITLIYRHTGNATILYLNGGGGDPLIVHYLKFMVEYGYRGLCIASLG